MRLDAVIKFLNGPHLNSEIFQFEYFFYDLVYINKEQKRILIDENFFDRFLECEYFKYGLTYLNLEEYFKRQFKDNEAHIKREIITKFMYAESSTFNITAFLKSLPDDLKMFVNNVSLKSIIQ